MDPAIAIPLPRAAPWYRRLALVGLRMSVAALVVWLVSSAAATWVLVHRRTARASEPVPAEDAGSFADVRLSTRDAEDLGAWFVSPPHPPVAVVVLHGNSGSRSGELGAIRFFASQGLAVLAPSLRAHGDSSGEVNDFGYGAREDVIAAVAFLDEHAPGVPILVSGRSLGAAAALFAAPELGSRVAGYVLEAPYRDLETATRHRLAARLPRPLAEIAYLGLRLWGPVFLRPAVEDVRPIDRVAGIPPEVGLVFLTGGSDELAPSSEVREMLARRPANASIVEFPGGHHLELSGANVARIRQAYLDAISAAARRSPPPSRGRRSRRHCNRGPREG